MAIPRENVAEKGTRNAGNQIVQEMAQETGYDEGEICKKGSCWRNMGKVFRWSLFRRNCWERERLVKNAQKINILGQKNKPHLSRSRGERKGSTNEKGYLEGKHVNIWEGGGRRGFRRVRKGNAKAEQGGGGKVAKWKHITQGGAIEGPSQVMEGGGKSRFSRRERGGGGGQGRAKCFKARSKQVKRGGLGREMHRRVWKQ